MRTHDHQNPFHTHVAIRLWHYSLHEDRHGNYDE